MAKTKFPRKEFEKHIKLTKEVQDKISMFGTHLESLTDEEIELEILPNRPDLFSMQGFVRAFRAFLGKSSQKKYKINPAEKDYKIIVDKSVEKIRPFSMAAIVKGIEFTDEKIRDIMQWQEKIHATVGRNRKKVALGYYVLNKIKFPVKYTAKNPREIIFEPLDMPEKMDAIKILSRHPCGREYGNQLNGFDKFPVYYDSNNEVLSMPPIINSNNSGKITPGVSDVLIECSGNNLNILKKVITMAVVDLIDMGGKAYAVSVIYENKSEQIDLSPEKMKISLEKANKLLGLNLKEKDLEKLLPKMGYNYSKGRISVPAYRTDILHEVDIIEDIAIAYGYDNFIPQIGKTISVGEECKESILKRKISEILSGLGLLESSSLHLTKPEETKKSSEIIEVANSKTEYKFLRSNLLIPALRILSENKDNEYPQRFFEIGTVFARNSKEETGIKEFQNLIIAISPGNFTEIKQILDYLARMLGLDFKIKESVNENLIEGRTGEILLNSNKIGFIGEVAPESLRSFSIKMPASIIEISLEEIFDLVKN